MKNLFLVFAVIFSNFVHSQKITGGFVAVAGASTKFQNTEKPFGVAGNFLVNVTLLARKTYHSVIYSCGDNSLRLLNGYLLPNDFDVYLLYSQKLDKRESYLGHNYIELGIKRKIELHKKVLLFPYLGFGTDFKKGKILSLGLLTAVNLF